MRVASLTSFLVFQGLHDNDLRIGWGAVTAVPLLQFVLEKAQSKSGQFMKRPITSVPQIYRNVRRWSEIVRTLSKYGLADWLSRFQFDYVTDLLKSSDGVAQSQLTQRQRIRLALTELGPTFIKFGQALSTRPDLIGHELADELATLQTNVPGDDFATVRHIIEEEQGRSIEELFEEFDPVPLASASIGQVHRAILRIAENGSNHEAYPHRDRTEENNAADDFDEEFLSDRFDRPFSDKEASEFDDQHAVLDHDPTLRAFEPLCFSADEIVSREVVVKIRHPGIERIIETDLDILSGLASLAERLEDFRNYQPVAVVKEISRTMRYELDFMREQRNLTQFRTLFKDEPAIIIPQPIVELCTSKMLTMQFVQGTPLRSFQAARFPELDPTKLARLGTNLYLKMIFNHGFYHADPHPGNILITDSGSIGLLDFGMVGRISERLREDIEAMLVAIIQQDVSMLTALIKRVGNCPPDLSESVLSIEVADFVGQYSTQVLSCFDLSGALVDFVRLVRKHQITLPSEASLLIKVLVSLEGTGKRLNPEFSLMEVMKPFQRKLLLRRLSPSRQIRKVRRFYMELEQLFDVLPQRISNILEQVQSGRFDVHLEHRRLGATANRLVLGMLTSALFLGSSLMLSYNVKPLLFPGQGPFGFQDVSVLGLAGMIASIMMGLRITLAIRRSGNLDQME
jgi:ubiquinone biosynthesis protein